MLSTFDNNKVQWNWSKFIKGGYIHFLQYVLGEKTVSKKIKCPTKEFQVHDNILSFTEHDVILCFESRVDTR